MIKNTCSSCLWFERNRNFVPDGVMSPEGFCHGDTPKALLLPNGEIRGWFSPIQATGWCKNYEMKTEGSA